MSTVKSGLNRLKESLNQARSNVQKEYITDTLEQPINKEIFSKSDANKKHLKKMKISWYQEMGKKLEIRVTRKTNKTELQSQYDKLFTQKITISK